MIGPRAVAAPRGRTSVAAAATSSGRPGRSRIARTSGRAPSPPPPRATSPAVAAASSMMASAEAGPSAVEAGPVAGGGSAAAAAAAALAQLRAVEALVADLGALGAELEFELTESDGSRLEAARATYLQEEAARRDARAARRAAKKAEKAAAVAAAADKAAAASAAAAAAVMPAVDVDAAAARRRRAGEASTPAPKAATTPKRPPAVSAGPAPPSSIGAALATARAGGARAASAARASTSGRAAAAAARRRRTGATAVSAEASAAALAAALPVSVAGGAAAALDAASAAAPAATRAAASSRGGPSPAPTTNKRAAARASTSPTPSASSPLARTIAHNPLLSAEQERDLAAAVQDAMALDALRVRLAEEGGGVAPTDEAWAAAAGADSPAALRARLAAGAAARDRMLGANTRLVLSIARRYAGKGLEFDDLVVEGMTGLARGIEKFDPGRGFKFSTYAHWWVRQAVTRAISEQARVVRLPVHLHEAMARVKKVEGQLAVSLGRSPTTEEVCAAAGMTPDRLDALKRVYILPRSFEEPAGGSGGGGGGGGGSGNSAGPTAGPAGGGGGMGEYEPSELGDAAESETAAQDGAVLLAGGLASDVEGALHTLAPRERGVLRMRYGLDDGRPKTLEEIGAAFAVTRERIRQIESKALLKLRAPERCAGLDEYADDIVEGGGDEVGWRTSTTRARQ